jgi:type III restriction enzyme
MIAFDPVYATRAVLDILPNPWVARRVIGDLLDGLRKRGFDDDKLGASSSYILEELRKWLPLTTRSRTLRRWLMAASWVVPG